MTSGAARQQVGWAVHNLIGHPLSEIAWWFRAKRFSNWLHDATVPSHEEGTGRG